MGFGEGRRGRRDGEGGAEVCHDEQIYLENIILIRLLFFRTEYRYM